MRKCSLSLRRATLVNGDPRRSHVDPARILEFKTPEPKTQIELRKLADGEVLRTKI
jgi:hypothetical protein